ncbi:MAG: fimbrillin family protein [Prevotellaceae bacterium]|nr:fimbrillin family protein [Prevotellaceae bacterium]
MGNLFWRGPEHPLYGLALLVCLTSCVNQVGNGPSTGYASGSIPITFTTTITQAATKVSGNAFENGDEAGLYAVLAPEQLSEERYLDNLRLDYGADGQLHAEVEVFYPEDEGATLDFYSYYPYRESGMAAGSQAMDICVSSDQSRESDYAASDFLLACTTGVQAGTQPVALTFEHRLAKINFTLSPQAGTEAADIVAADPVIIVDNLHTSASLDLQTGSFTYDDTYADIIPYGNWTEADGIVAGKSCIVLPQPLEQGLEVTMEWGGKLYTCPLTLDSIESDTEITVNIEATPSEEETLTGMVADIKAWSNTQTLDTENHNSLSRISVAALNFEQSGIYHVHHLGQTVAEVCKEYLYDTAGSHPVDAQAIVLYPVTGGEADLTQGTVLQLLGETEAIHGGTVSWDTADGTFTYTPGNSPPITCFYIDEDGTPTLTPPDNALTVTVGSYLLNDTRSGLYTYPVVKVGTQYWMRDDLHTTFYNDGEAIPPKTALNEGAGYFQWEYDMTIYLYNGEAVLTGKMAPQGWRIPTESDWTRLKTYVKEDASKLKGGTWEALNGKLSPYTNETGLNLHPDGMLSPSLGYVNRVYNAVYWTSGENGEPLGQHTVYLHSDSNEIAFQSTQVDNIYIAVSIRCLKE